MTDTVDFKDPGVRHAVDAAARKDIADLKARVAALEERLAPTEEPPTHDELVTMDFLNYREKARAVTRGRREEG
jgi:hypothetical protein